MANRYQVKWEDKKLGTCFGIVQNFGEKPPKGKLFVEDAVLPVTHTVASKDLTDIPFGGGGARDEYCKYVDEKLKEAQAASDAAGGGSAGKQAVLVGRG